MTEDSKRKAAAIALEEIQANIDDPDYDKHSDEILKKTRDNLIEYIKDE